MGQLFTWGTGLLEYKNNKLTAVHNTTNTPMVEVSPGDLRPTGIDMDDAGNLWFAVSDVTQYINVRKQNGTYLSFDMGTGRFTRRILVDRNNYIWALHEREGGLTVFNHNNFSTPILNDNFKVLTKAYVSNGNLQSNSVFSIAEDKDGKIWVGTAAGVVVFYNPTSIFNSTSFDAQPIKIVQDGNVELLLGDEIVSSICL